MKFPIRPGELSLRAAPVDRCCGQGPKPDILQLSIQGVPSHKTGGEEPNQGDLL